MANIPEIKIQIDENALRTQVRDAIQAEFAEFAMRLRIASDVLDGEQFINQHEKWQADERKKEYKRGYEEGKAARDE